MNILAQNIKTMSSREIAVLASKEHSHVIRDIRSMLSQIDDPNMDDTDFKEIFDNRGYTSEIKLNKDLTLTLVAGYNSRFRYAVIKRWQELEQQAQANQPVMPALPQSFSEALLLAGTLQQKIEQDAPKVAHYNKVVDRHTLLTATQVGQKIGMSARKLNVLLGDLNVYNKSVKRSKVFNTWFMDKGLGELKQVDNGYDQALFTLKGEAWVIEQFIVEVA